MPIKKPRSNSLENIFVSETHRSIYLEISHIKKRIHLVEGERKANYEFNEEHIKKNETYIIELRGQNSQLKKESKETVSTRKDYFKIICEFFGDEKKALAFRNKNYDQTVDILVCKYGDSRNKLNLIRYEKNNLNFKVSKILQEEEKIKKTLESQGHSTTNNGITTTTTASNKTNKKNINPRQLEIKDSENGTSLVQMRIIEAENIRSRYKNMFSTLKDLNFSKIINIKELESKILLQNKEILQIRKVVNDANRARNISRKKLIEIEEQTIKEYSEREEQILESRLKLKKIRENMELIGSKLSFPKFHMIHRDSSAFDTGSGMGFMTNGLGQLGQLGQNDSKPQSLIEIVYTKLREKTGENDPELIVARVQQQREHSKELEKKELKIKSEVRKLKLKKRFLYDKLNQLRFSGGIKRSELNDQSLAINEEIYQVKCQIQESKDMIKGYSDILDQMLLKLTNICDCNNILQLPDFALDEYSGQRILKILKLILSKIEVILEEDEEGHQEINLKISSPTISNNYNPEESIHGGISAFSGSPFGSQTDLDAMIQFQQQSTFIRRPSMIPAGEMPPLMPLLDLSSLSMGDLSGAGMLMVNNDNIDGSSEILTPIMDKRSSRSGGGVSGGSGVVKTFTKKNSSSEEEEYVLTRNQIKRSSQILIETKRKGKFSATPQTARSSRH